MQKIWQATNGCVWAYRIPDEISFSDGCLIYTKLKSMENLPSISLSKSILIATPLFCLVIALLDASDQLSYLFVLDFMGNMAGAADITFIPTLQPEITSPNFNRNMLLKQTGVNPNANTGAFRVPLVNLTGAEQWSQRNDIVRGVSPRWIVPVEIGRTDGLILVANTSKESSMGIGLNSDLQPLAKDEVALSEELLNKLEVGVGDSISVTFSITNLFQGSKLLQKYKSVGSKTEYAVDQNSTLSADQVSSMIYSALKDQLPPQANISESDVRRVVEAIYSVELTKSYRVKYEYKNRGLYTSALHNVVLMEYAGFADVLASIVDENIIQNDDLVKFVFDGLEASGLPPEQITAAKLYYRTARATGSYRPQLQETIRDGVYNNPVMVSAAYSHRQLLYHPNKEYLGQMFTALQTTPGTMELVSLYPLYHGLEGIRYFFKSVIQIFTFICGVIYFYIMVLILKRTYEEKEVEVGIWRTLGAGGVSIKPGEVGLAPKLTLGEKLRFGYQVMVKVGYVYYWFASGVVSMALYIFVKQVIYWIISSELNFDTPPQPIYLPVLILLAVFFFPTALAVLHLRSIYTQPLASTIKPIKRTFDVVKVRIVKLATFGITVDLLVIAGMLIYYGVVSYYAIPWAILHQEAALQTYLFNSIFLFMILGAIMLLGVLQSRMECILLKLIACVSKPVSKLEAIMLKSIRAGQYKNIKVAIVTAIIFAFLLFFSSGLKIQAEIVESFIERQLGAEIVLQNYQKNTFNRTQVEEYLNSVEGVRYSWLSQDLDNKQVDMEFQSIVTQFPIPAIFKVATGNYLDTTYFKYYYPERYYEPDMEQYQVLPNGVVNGFSSLYEYDGGYNNVSVGRYDPDDTLRTADPHGLNFGGYNMSDDKEEWNMAPQQQVINVAVTSLLRRLLGASPGDYFKLTVGNPDTLQYYQIRCRIMHSLKIGPGLDLFVPVAFISQQQANYLYRVVGYEGKITYERLFITGGSNLRAVGNKVVSMSPEHTQLFEMALIRESFEVMTGYLAGFIVVVTIILAVLSALFLSVYTYSKCREEAVAFKMLRAVGLSVLQLRLSIFLEIFLRLVVSIINGIALGVLFSLGLAGQVEEVLMINTPPLEMGGIFLIALFMLGLFSVVVVQSTAYLARRTVLQTAKG